MLVFNEVVAGVIGDTKNGEHRAKAYAEVVAAMGETVTRVLDDDYDKPIQVRGGEWQYRLFREGVEDPETRHDKGGRRSPPT